MVLAWTLLLLFPAAVSPGNATVGKALEAARAMRMALDNQIADLEQLTTTETPDRPCLVEPLQQMPGKRTNASAVPGADVPLPLQGVHLRIGTLVEPPVVIRREVAAERAFPSNDLYSGIIIDVLKAHRWGTLVAIVASR
jgi:hypothetical protein